MFEILAAYAPDGGHLEEFFINLKKKKFMKHEKKKQFVIQQNKTNIAEFG